MVRRIPIVALLVGILLLMAAPPAGAHALVRRSDPHDGALLDQAPRRVTITFTEAPDSSVSVVHVLDSSGRDVAAGKAVPQPGNPLTLVIPMGKVGQGVYTVTWRVVSRADGHVTAGSFSFGG